ncbi:hypothetical protein [uncultured Gimesia sp.]|uniref:hypothetical protein n=1 Tax=uncultured Gimesia sp. TaxID=1678688 RepID=UPI00262B6BA5|nr:hypothetical protein [uncultured Gimesia sp.]
MDSAEHEETKENQPQLESTAKSSSSPLLVRSLVMVFLIVLLIGIYFQRSPNPDSKENSFEDDLQKLALAYHEFHRIRKHSPADMEALQDFLNNPPPAPKSNSIVPPDPVSIVLVPDSIVEMIRDGRIKVIWGAVLTDSGLENDKSLLAYRSDIALNGGFALTAAGRALELTVDAFKKYPLVSVETANIDETETKQKVPESEKKE